jgi:hypothetical protein
MTAAFAVYSLGVGAYAPRLATLSRPASLLTAANSAAMAAIAALPLDAPGGDGPHVVAAGAGYVSLTLAPLVAARAYRKRGDRRSAATAKAAGAATGTCLLASLLHRRRAGAWQRAGLTAGQAWIALSAARSIPA